MKKRYAALLALPLVLPAMAIARDHKPADGGKADWHAEMCSDRYAHTYGKIAFLQAKLGITDKQQDAWNKFASSEEDSAAKERDACLADKPPAEDSVPTVLEQEDHLEKMLSAKLEMLQASRPALQDLYKLLSSDQKVEFDRFGEEHMGPHGHPGAGGERQHEGKPE